MSAKEIETKVSELITDELSAMGYELVRVQLTGGGSYLTLQVMAERIDERAMTVDDCVKISHATSKRIDADESLADRYTLEVSSPGIDRPLVRLKDFERFTGHMARVELEAPLEVEAGKKQKRFNGSIVRINGNDLDAEVEFCTENGAVLVPMSNIARAKLVPTDAPLRAHGGAKH